MFSKIQRRFNLVQILTSNIQSGASTKSPPQWLTLVKSSYKNLSVLWGCISTRAHSCCLLQPGLTQHNTGLQQTTQSCTTLSSTAAEALSPASCDLGLYRIPTPCFRTYSGEPLMCRPHQTPWQQQSQCPALHPLLVFLHIVHRLESSWDSDPCCICLSSTCWSQT